MMIILGLAAGVALAAIAVVAWVGRCIDRALRGM